MPRDDVNRFLLSEIHLKLLQNANVRWSDHCSGAPAIDPLRPYGNSDIESDVARVLGIGEEFGPDERQRESLYAIHKETATALEIVLQLRTFTPGIYVRRDRFEPWEFHQGISTVNAEQEDGI